ncbi:MAG TPA: cytochrome C oxidase subunit IV family protein [Sphingomicrobium sp.]|jgi:cytochrome c oxidase subunit 4|nr:cytochrome C oxidase subunit IV family protein [Sphingomicrobium sp.]
MSAGTILRCWLALMVLLALTTALAFVPLGSANLFVSLAIAAAKALLVLIVFMELKASSSLIRAAAAAGFFWLMIMIALTTADYTHRTDQRVPLDTVR